MVSKSPVIAARTFAMRVIFQRGLVTCSGVPINTTIVIQAGCVAPTSHCDTLLVSQRPVNISPSFSHWMECWSCNLFGNTGQSYNCGLDLWRQTHNLQGLLVLPRFSARFTLYHGWMIIMFAMVNFLFSLCTLL